jgi:hypothetical protein
MSRASSKLLYAEIQKAIAGLEKHFAGQTLVLGGNSITTAALITEFTGLATQLSSVETARQSWLVQTKALDEAVTGTFNARLAALHRFVVNQFGLSGAELVDFGMKPRQTRKRTGQEIVETAQKSAATRTARHTTGPRQKKAIHGTAAAPVTTEPAAPTPPTPAPDTKRNA